MANRSTAKNKRIICFVDETGSVGEDTFSLGVVMAFSNDVARIDKLFSDILPVGSNEFHANKLENDFVLSILGSFTERSKETSIMLFSHYKNDIQNQDKNVLYALKLIDAIKPCMKKFRDKHKLGHQINNVEVIVDACEQNISDAFNATIDEARKTDGVFRGVNRVVAIDSSVSRLIQVADGIAYLRHLVRLKTITAKQMSDDIGIIVI